MPIIQGRKKTYMNFLLATIAFFGVIIMVKIKGIVT